MANLSNISEEATQKQNVTGVMTPILTFSPDDGLAFIIENRVPMGSAVGVPIYADLRDTNGDPLPLDTEVALQYQRPTDDDWQTVSMKWRNIQNYNSRTISEQQNEEYIDRAKHELKGDRLAVRDIDMWAVSILSSKEIDWSQSKLYVEEKAVSEVSN